MNKLLYFIIVLLFITRANAQNVGIGTSSPNAKAALDINSTSQGLLPPRMTTIQRNAITSPPAGLIIYNLNVNAFQCYNGAAWYSTVHYIGESYGGGIVFYVYDNGQHGLIAAVADQSTGELWSNGTNRYTGSTGDGLNAGSMNTTMIVATQIADNQTGNFAAKVCADYSVTVAGITYGDWYLPSKYELNLLYLQQAQVGVSANYYWSSSEVDNGFAWVQSFFNGVQTSSGKYNIFFQPYVRAIRSF